MANRTAKLVITFLIGLSILTPLAFADNGDETTGPVTTPPPIIPPGVESEALIIPHADDPENQGAYFQGTYLPAITSVIIGMAGGLAFLFIVIGGIQLLTAYGDEEKITGAKKTITYAIVGLLVAILSYAIVSIISGIQIGQTPQQVQQAQGPAPGTEDTIPADDEDPRYGPGGSEEGKTADEIWDGVSDTEI